MKRISINDLQKFKSEKQSFAVLTAYDATFASLIETNGVDVILVGDSLGMVIQGHSSTVPVTLQQMEYHIANVARGTKRALIIGDMPYMSYSTPEQTYQTAAAIMRAGANMVKLEGGDWLVDSIKGLTERGIPVCAHLGLTPQSVDALGGYKVQGRDEAAAEKLLADAKAVEAAGAKLLVMECVPAELARKVTESLSIPTIGIGAGNACDAQVLVLYDMLGLNPHFMPKFVENFMAKANGNVAAAISLYANEVKSRTFPSDKHSF